MNVKKLDNFSHCEEEKTAVSSSYNKQIDVRSFV